MSCKKDWVQNYSDFPTPEKVRLGDNGTVEACLVKVKSGDVYKPVEFSDVIYVPNLANNYFLSVH